MGPLERALRTLIDIEHQNGWLTHFALKDTILKAQEAVLAEARS